MQAIGGLRVVVPEAVQPPKDPGGADVDAGAQAGAVLVPVVGMLGPEAVGATGRFSVGQDRLDRLACAGLTPGGIGKLLVVLGCEEIGHGWPWS